MQFTKEQQEISASSAFSRWSHITQEDKDPQRLNLSRHTHASRPLISHHDFTMSASMHSSRATPTDIQSIAQEKKTTTYHCMYISVGLKQLLCVSDGGRGIL